ncbi:MAG TPA: hypothetical protein DD437_09325 [Rhodobiaceae bacterium]|nr:hypothetical protein [Rhodobiaceae bacterium]
MRGLASPDSEIPTESGAFHPVFALLSRKWGFILEFCGRVVFYQLYVSAKKRVKLARFLALLKTQHGFGYST